MATIVPYKHQPGWWRLDGAFSVPTDILPVARSSDWLAIADAIDVASANTSSGGLLVSCYHAGHGTRVSLTSPGQVVAVLPSLEQGRRLAANIRRHLTRGAS